MEVEDNQTTLSSIPSLGRHDEDSSENGHHILVGFVVLIGGQHRVGTPTKIADIGRTIPAQPRIGDQSRYVHRWGL